MKPGHLDSEPPGMMMMSASRAALPMVVEAAGDARYGRTLPRDERERIIRRLRFLARLLDDAVTIPGTNYAIGLDPVIGLAPGVGDAVSLAISGYIIFEGWRLGASRATLTRMVANVAIDALIGLVPVAGDVADVAFKANQRNLRLLGITPVKPGDPLD